MAEHVLPCHVVAMPYPGRGHINAMLNLSRLLAARQNIAITFVVTEEWLSLLGTPLPRGVHFETIPNVIPSEHGRAANFDAFFEAVYTKMEEPFERLLDRLERPPSAVVADTNLSWAVEVGNRRGIPVCSLFTMSAAYFTQLYHFHRLPPAIVAGGDPHETVGADKYIPELNFMKVSDLEPVINAPKEILKRVLGSFSFLPKAHCLIFTSFYEIEANVVESLRAELPIPIYTIGPAVPYESSSNSDTNSDYFTWLNSQPMNSVLYVSLGSFLPVSPAQLDELANGLVISGIKFLWVARGNSSYLNGLVSKTGNGLILPWCDQMKVLCHPSVGGFLTHCGWNSTLEAVFAGVPMITLPLLIDQLTDSRLIVDVWRVGLNLKDKVGKDGVVARKEIAEVVKCLMDQDGMQSKEIRRKAQELKETSHRAIEEGGSSHSCITSFIVESLQFKNTK